MASINCDSYIGKQIGNYTLEDVLGRGRFACVYRAVHKHLSNLVFAIKLLDPQYLGSPTEEDFRREAEFLQKLQHPHILSLHDFGEARELSTLLLSMLPEKLSKNVLQVFHWQLSKQCRY